MRLKVKFKFLCLAFVLLFLLLKFCLPAGVEANMANPSQPGAAGAEPSGLEQVYIASETLSIDLRKLAEVTSSEDDQTILVEVIYVIENQGAERQLELVFAFGSHFKEFQIWLDEREITSQNISNFSAPESWRPPGKTPWLNGREFEYSDNSSAGRAQGFSFLLPPGTHRLKARYKASPSFYNDYPMKYWQFVYVLAPAREWAGFGGLDVTINAPKDWTVVTTPSLQRDGDILKGHFDQIPADALALTAQSTLPASYKLLEMFYFLLFGLTLLATPLLIALFAWRRGYQLKLSWLIGISLSLLWTLLVFGTGLLAVFGADYTIPRSQFSASGYNGIFYIFGLLVIGTAAFFFGIALWFLFVYLARRRKMQKNLLGI
jgi:hypothetical protein